MRDLAGARLDVRRLTALDMHGKRGTRRRRLIILAEFALGTLACAGLGVWVLTLGGAAGLVIGVWLVGLGANYLLLTWNAGLLWRPRRLREELAGADLHAELRHYTRAQIWVLVPFWIAGLAIVQAVRRNSGS
jgi:hypothetical protein